MILDRLWTLLLHNETCIKFLKKKIKIFLKRILPVSQEKWTGKGKQNTVQLGYNVMKGNEYFVSL
jgi:hypothetical protein